MINVKRVNIKDKPTPYYDLYMGRKNGWLGLEESKWANPFPLKNETDRPNILAKHMQYMRSRPDLIAALPEINNKVVACYCPAHKRCHVDNLIDLLHEFHPEL